MICPLKFNQNTISTAGQIYDTGECECEGTNCMWWYFPDGTCSIVAITKILKSIMEDK